jgi:hypothetical protein
MTTKMYINQILQYLLWPAFIIICWFVVKKTLTAYEKKFPVSKRINTSAGKDENSAGQVGDQSSIDK